MKNFLDFLTAALPYIAIGFWVAFTITKSRAMESGQKMGMKWGNFFPPAAMLFVSILEFADGDRSNGITWLTLAAVFFVFNLMQDKKGEL